MNRGVKVSLVIALVVGGVFTALLIRKKMAESDRTAQFRENEKRVTQILAANEERIAAVERLLEELKSVVAGDQWMAQVPESGNQVDGLADTDAYFLIWRHELIGEEVPKGFVQTFELGTRERIEEWKEYPSSAADDVDYLQPQIDEYVASVQRKYAVIAQVTRFMAAKVETIDTKDKARNWLATPGRVDFILAVYDVASKKLLAQTKGAALSTIADPNKKLENRGYDVLSEDLWKNARLKAKAAIEKLSKSPS